MTIYCASFGTIWWFRPGANRESSFRFTRDAALFNTTGFSSGARERRSWTQVGLVRFNVGTCLEQRLDPSTLAPGNYETPGLEQRGSQNRLLISRRMGKQVWPDAVMFCVKSEDVGRITFDRPWRSDGVRLLSASDFRGAQESLIVIPPTGSITTSVGKWGAEWTGETWRLAKI
jgi:hypothetical protein